MDASLAMQSGAWLADNGAVYCPHFKARWHPRYCREIQERLENLHWTVYRGREGNLIIPSHWHPCRECPNNGGIMKLKLVLASLLAGLAVSTAQAQVSVTPLGNDQVVISWKYGIIYQGPAHQIPTADINALLNREAVIEQKQALARQLVPQYIPYPTPAASDYDPRVEGMLNRQLMRELFGPPPFIINP